MDLKRKLLNTHKQQLIALAINEIDYIALAITDCISNWCFGFVIVGGFADDLRQWVGTHV